MKTKDFDFDIQGLLAKATFHVSYNGNAISKPLQQVNLAIMTIHSCNTKLSELSSTISTMSESFAFVLHFRFLLIACDIICGDHQPKRQVFDSPSEDDNCESYIINEAL